jgi:GNAT superfamily N-acetyltransferase
MPDIEIHALVPELWEHFETLFGPRGACGGCWCMYWKLGRKDFEKGQGETNRLAQKTLVESGCNPGLLAYVDGIPAGWIAVEPRNQYPTLARSRILKPVDDIPVWSVTCFFVAKAFRGFGLTVSLLETAVEHTRMGGGQVLEGYPVEPRVDVKYPAAFVYTGLSSAYLKAGFTEVGRRSATRPIMRRSVYS